MKSHGKIGESFRFREKFTETPGIADGIKNILAENTKQSGADIISILRHFAGHAA